jgi:hypothetical protein
MHWTRSIARELLGLFVDDGSFATAILIWAAVVVLVLARVTHHAAWTGPTLFTGLALILIESTLRYARRRVKGTRKR